MTTENILRRLNLLDGMDRNSKGFRELSSSLETIIDKISPNEFERKDFLMKRLTQICCS